jgi:hypothetical protein
MSLFEFKRQAVLNNSLLFEEPLFAAFNLWVLERWKFAAVIASVLSTDLCLLGYAAQRCRLT